MRLEALTLTAFRNLQPVALSFGGGVNFIHGLNGQGKTNLLEAVVLVVNGTSPRTSTLTDTIPWGAPQAELGGLQEAFGVNYRVAMAIRPGAKSLQVDGTPRRSVPGVSKGCLALTFLPEDLALLTGEPMQRRDFLDRSLTLWDTAHAADLKAYGGALLNRNRLLKELASGRARGSADALLGPYEQILIGRGAAIARRRAVIASELDAALATSVAEFAVPLTIRATYVPKMPELLDPSGEGEARASARLHDRREVDLIQKRTTLGPHRDDLQVDCKGAGVRAFASRGETRLVMVMLLIAKLRAVMARLQFTPLIVLDDIFSELDPERRQLVIRALPADAQVFCSAVERDLSGAWVQDRSEVRAFHVAEGRVEESPL